MIDKVEKWSSKEERRRKRAKNKHNSHQNRNSYVSGRVFGGRSHGNRRHGFRNNYRGRDRFQSNSKFASRKNPAF